MTGRVHPIWLTSVSGLALFASSAVYAQSAPVAAALPRDDAAQETIDRVQGEAEKIRRQSSKTKQQLDKEKAAESLSPSGQDEVLDALPTEEKLAQWRAASLAHPENMDLLFAYAQLAGKLGHYEEAAAAYERMLAIDPNLDRVRLDLGAMYIRLGHLPEAQRELNAVLNRQPPEQVRANIEAILAQVTGELNENLWDGSVTFGFNADSNGNSAPNGDRILLFSDPNPQLLPEDQQRQSDLQFFGAASVNHTYRPKWAKGKQISGVWKSNLTGYQANQATLTELNLQLLSLKTGPEFRSSQSGIMVSPTVTYNHISLDNHTYLRNSAMDLTGEVPVTSKVMLTGNLKHELRHFENAPGVTVYEDRNGSATQLSLGGKMLVTPTDFVIVEGTTRRERTRVDYYDNSQLGATASYTHVFPKDVFANANVGYKMSQYDGPDAQLISPITRRDKETTLGVAVGKKITPRITASVGYQYRTTDSNIINYEYDNHRVTTAVSARF